MVPMRAFAFAMVLMVGAAPSLADSKSDPNGFGKKTVALFDAMKANDVAALDGMLAPHVVFTNFAGVVGARADYLAVFSRKILTIEAYKLDPVSVEVYGDAAVVVYRITITAHTGTQPWPKQLISTDTWVKQAAGWQLAARHSSAMMVAPQH